MKMEVAELFPPKENNFVACNRVFPFSFLVPFFSSRESNNFTRFFASLVGKPVRRLNDCIIRFTRGWLASWTGDCSVVHSDSNSIGVDLQIFPLYSIHLLSR